VKSQLTVGPPLRTLCAFGLPLVVGSIAHALFNLVDVWLVGRYAPTGPGTIGREAALAAIHAASVLNFLPMLLANGISVATIATVSRAIGAGDGVRAGAVMHRSMVLTLLLGMAIGVLAGLTAPWQIRMLEVSAEAAGAATECLEVMSYGTVTMFALLQITAVERAAGRSTPPVVLLIGANLVNAGASVWLIPRYGAPGTAWATVLSRGLFSILGLVWLYGRSPDLRAAARTVRGLLRESYVFVKLGIPATLQLFARAVAVLLVTRLLAEGAKTDAEITEISAAYGVALRLEMIAMFACAGWGSAVAAAVGQCLGAGMLDRAIRMAWVGSLAAGAGMVLLGAAFYFGAPQIFPWFVEDEHATRIEALVRYGTDYFRTVAFAYAFVGIGIVLAESVNGSGATRQSFFIDFTLYVGGVWGLSALLLPRNGIAGLWIALLVVHTAAAVVYAACFRSVLRARLHRHP